MRFRPAWDSLRLSKPDSGTIELNCVQLNIRDEY